MLIFQTGKVFKNLLISFSAEYIEVHKGMGEGALFQSFLPSLINELFVFCFLLEPLVSGSLLLDTDLEDLTSGLNMGVLKLSGLWLRFKVFQTSINLIWAFIWWTESMLNRFNFALFKYLTNLFWTLWILFWIMNWHSDLAHQLQAISNFWVKDNLSIMSLYLSGRNEKGHQ